MKKPIVRIWLAAMLLAGALAAQDAAPPAEPALPTLPQTMMLAIQGHVVWMEAPIDFSLAVSGPDFSASTSIGDAKIPANRVWMDFSGTVQVKGERYLVSYALSWRVPAPNFSGRNGAMTTSYESLAMQNSVYLRPGVPMTLLDEQGKKLTLTIEQPGEKKAPAPLRPPA